VIWQVKEIVNRISIFIKRAVIKLRAVVRRISSMSNSCGVAAIGEAQVSSHNEVIGSGITVLSVREIQSHIGTI